MSKFLNAPRVFIACRIVEESAAAKLMLIQKEKDFSVAPGNQRTSRWVAKSDCTKVAGGLMVAAWFCSRYGLSAWAAQ